MIDRRAFLKSLLGIAAGAALPAAFEPLAEIVRAPDEAPWDGSVDQYTLSFMVSVDGAEWRRVQTSIEVPRGDGTVEFPVIKGVTVKLDRSAGTADFDFAYRNLVVEESQFPDVGKALRVDNVRVALFQLEYGPVATPFEARADLAACQRYVEDQKA